MRNRISTGFDWSLQDRLHDPAVKAADRLGVQLARIGSSIIVAGISIAGGLVAVAMAIWLAFN